MKKKNGMVINGLNLKQRLFVKEYVQSGNATASYMNVYKVKNYNTANALGNRLIAKDSIKQAIGKLVEKVHNTPEHYYEQNVTKIIEAGTSDIALRQAKPSDAIKGLELYAKLKRIGGFSDPSTVHQHIHLSNLSKTELLAEATKLDSMVNDIVTVNDTGTT